MNPKKNWKTTVGGVVGVLLMAAGIFWPDAIDADTQLAVQASIASILQGIGGLITAATLIFAKDGD